MKALKKIWNVLTTVLVVLMVICAAFLMGSRLLGYKCYTVISGSMEPQYKVGDLIYVKAVDVNTIKEGDVITFVLNEDLVVATHRVVSVDGEHQRFYTKGDANDIADSEPVHFKNVIGIPRFSIPKLGYVSDFIQHPPGMYITIGIGILLILAVFLPDLHRKQKDDVPDGEACAVRAELDSVSEENQRLRAEMERLRRETFSAPDAPKESEAPAAPRACDEAPPSTAPRASDEAPVSTSPCASDEAPASVPAAPRACACVTDDAESAREGKPS